MLGWAPQLCPLSAFSRFSLFFAPSNNVLDVRIEVQTLVECDSEEFDALLVFDQFSPEPESGGVIIFFFRRFLLKTKQGL